MLRRSLSILILILVASGFLFAKDGTATNGELQMTVRPVATVLDAPGTPQKLLWFDIEVYLTNISERPVTVPTLTAPDSDPWWCEQNSIRNVVDIHYSFYPVFFNGKPLKISPLRFAPVTLLPGESTQLKTVKLTGITWSNKKKLNVRFSVEESVATQNNWYCGDIDVSVEPQEPK